MSVSVTNDMRADRGVCVCVYVCVYLIWTPEGMIISLRVVQPNDRT